MQGNLINQLAYSRELIHYPLCNFAYYQNALMQKSELEVNLINPHKSCHHSK